MESGTTESASEGDACTAVSADVLCAGYDYGAEPEDHGAEQLTENGPAAEPEAETVIVRHSPHRSKGKMERDLQSVPTMDQDCTLSEEVLTALFPDGYTELPAEKMRPLLEYTPAHM